MNEHHTDEPGKDRQKGRNLPPSRKAYRASELPDVLPFGKTAIAAKIRSGEIKSRLIGRSRIVTAEEVERLIRGE